MAGGECLSVQGTLPSFLQWYTEHEPVDDAPATTTAATSTATAINATSTAAESPTVLTPWTSDEIRGALMFPVLTYLNLDNNRVVAYSSLDWSPPGLSSFTLRSLLGEFPAHFPFCINT